MYHSGDAVHELQNLLGRKFSKLLLLNLFFHTLTVSRFNCSASVKLLSSSSSSLDCFLSFVSITGQREGSSCPRGKMNTLLTNSYRSKKNKSNLETVQVCCTADFDWPMSAVTCNNWRLSTSEVSRFLRGHNITLQN